MIQNTIKYVCGISRNVCILQQPKFKSIEHSIGIDLRTNTNSANVDEFQCGNKHPVLASLHLHVLNTYIM